MFLSVSESTMSILRRLKKPEEDYDVLIRRLIREWKARGEAIKVLGPLADKAMEMEAEG